MSEERWISADALAYDVLNDRYTVEIASSNVVVDSVASR
jgi:hypothetical protein